MPSHQVAEEQLPLLRLVSRRFRDHITLKAVKLAFIPASGRLLRWSGRYASNHASLAPVPGHPRRPGDFRSYCHAPARLWPPKPSTDSLDLTHNRPALGARLFQTGALPTHRCPVKPGKRWKRSRDCASCRRKRQPSQTLAVLSLPAAPGRCNKRPGSVYPSHHCRCQESAS